MAVKILVADDERAVLRAISMYLRNEGYKVISASNGKEAWELLQKEQPAVAILDVKMPFYTGIELIEMMNKNNIKTMVIILTAYPDIEHIIPAMKLGAYEFLQKPVDLKDLKSIVRKAVKNYYLKYKMEDNSSDKELITESGIKVVSQSPKMQAIFKLIGRIADNDINVLITGESGTGKEVIAKIIHYNSYRADKPFVAVNCTAIPSGLVESEFFGYERGAFTGADSGKPGKFEMANGGTLFLDEVIDMDLELQPKLLRALQEREIYRVGGNKPIKLDVRVISSTNKDPEQSILEGKLREDLYHRLKGIHIHLPPLRERREDIYPLAMIFLKETAKKYGKIVREISEEVMEIFLNYKWPGNVRELKNTIEAAVAICSEAVLLPEHLPGQLDVKEERIICNIEEWIDTIAKEEFEKCILTNSIGNLYDKVLGQIEKKLIAKVLNLCNGNQSKAARILGITRNTLRSKIKLYKIASK